jgi:two-component system alkaline phosphatase synthesis response regulator PhoP
MNDSVNDQSHNKKILLAEDDSILAEMYQLKFTQEGFQVFLAGDGEEAIRSARKNRPDIVLLDILMPKKDGIEVAVEMKGDPDLRDIPIIFLTNLGGREGDEEAGRSLGALDVITKAEVTPQKIADKIKDILKIPA